MKTSIKTMKSNSLKSILALSAFALFTVSCDKDDDTPEAVDEEEVITTMNVTLTSAGGENVVLQSRDLDGDGPNPPVISVSANLAASKAYMGSIELLNETETPAENITLEVEEEADEHQFFFSTDGALSSTEYSDQDENGNPIGISFDLVTGEAGTGTIQIILRHEPKKPNDGSLADAGGSTDISQTFSVTVE